MNYFESLTFVTKDEHWTKKIALGMLASLLSVVLVGAIALWGWSMEAFRRAASDADEKLPGWQDVGMYVREGFTYFAVSVIWSIPIIILIALFRALGAALLYAYEFTMVGAFLVVMRNGTFTEALDPRNGWRLLRPRTKEWLCVAIIAAFFVLLPTYILVVLANTGSSFLTVIGGFVLLAANAWFHASIGNLIGRLYREYGATV